VDDAAAHPIELRDGRAVAIRPIAADDRERVAAAFRRLSPESRRRRFLTPATELSPEDLDYLTDVDHRRHEAMVALDPADGAIVGTARYVQVPGEREVAEVATEVADDWQRRGVATALLAALSERALANGVERYRAYVSTDNEVVVDALRRHAATRTPFDGPELLFEVEVPREGLGDRLDTALRAAGAGQLRLAKRVGRRLGIWPRG
jgi:RimJ/RimL family protein N-acetyltransferase